jgi:DNA-binding response OmpR family regulator
MEQARATGDGRWPAKRVLLVDDEARLRGILARYLRARGHVVLEASTAAEARAALADGQVEVLLLDVNLPDETGWAVLRWARARALSAPDDWRQPRVVVMSAVPPSATRVEQFGPEAVLNKPFPIEALARLVELNCAPAALERADAS